MLIALLACTTPSYPTLPHVEPSTQSDSAGPPQDTDDAADTEDTHGTDSGGADAWHIQIGAIPGDLAAQMQGTTMHSGCPVPLDELVLIEAAHWDMTGAVQTGQLIVAAAVSAEVAVVLEAMFRAEFPIRSMIPASAFGGSDDASMAADNTSAFNCRAVTGGSSWSQHSYGNAIDINPIENPYINGTTVLPPEGQSFSDRSDVRAGMIIEGDAVTTAFDAIGWGWGGQWSSLKDYQHFSENGQ